MLRTQTNSFSALIMVGLKYYSKLEFILSPKKVRVKKDIFVLNVFFYWSIIYFYLRMYNNNNNKYFMVNQDALKEQINLYYKSKFLVGFDSMGSFRGNRLKRSKLSRIKPKTLTKKRKARLAVSPIKSPPSKRFI
jgi:hypothetical protein